MANRVKLTPEDFRIRRAILSDCPAMLGLVKELAAYEKGLDRVTVTLEEMQECGFGAKPVWWAFVAELTTAVTGTAAEGEPSDSTSFPIIGMALYYHRYSTWRGRILYLEDFIVSEPYRGNGIGERLFETTMQQAKTEGFHGMAWQVLDWNEPALNFYRKYKADLDPEWVNGMIFF